MENITQKKDNSIISEGGLIHDQEHPLGFQSGAKPLDLINGHLTELTFIPATRASEHNPVNWFRKSQDYNPHKQFHYVAKIQNFRKGGYEVTILRQDLESISHNMDSYRKTGTRLKGEQNPNDIARSVQRSKQKIRHKIKSIGCDRMLTLTKKESNPLHYWSIDQWKIAWDKFNRLCKKSGTPLEYVAVLEKHKKGNYHLHAAIKGRINVKLIRRLWLACVGGKGQGNIDVSFKRNVSIHRRSSGLALYLSKYISKQIDQVEFNKKRYWSSKHKLIDPMRYILNSDSIKDALLELGDYLDLKQFELNDTAFFFSNEIGCWFSYDDHLSIPPDF